MAASLFAAELARYGPHAADAPPPAPADAAAYCRRLARTHYENFTVASWLLPRGLRQHFCNVYAFCRWADDLADETADPLQSLALLDWWEDQLRACRDSAEHGGAGAARHPVFVALGRTIAEFDIPIEPFADLLAAFRRDQRQSRYDTFDELLDYCRYSANPVGRLVLYLGRCHDERTGAVADSICTGLQLANFWQDVARDYARGRMYLPRESLARFGCGEQDIAACRVSEPLRRVLAVEVERAESYLKTGRRLVPMVPRELRVDVALFIEGGLAILRAIRRAEFDVWSRRPTVGKWEKLRLVARAWWRGG
jgi:squalene synthase HpnC